MEAWIKPPSPNVWGIQLNYIHNVTAHKLKNANIWILLLLKKLYSFFHFHTEDHFIVSVQQTLSSEVTFQVYRSIKGVKGLRLRVHQCLSGNSGVWIYKHLVTRAFTLLLSCNCPILALIMTSITVKKKKKKSKNLMPFKIHRYEICSVTIFTL